MTRAASHKLAPMPIDRLGVDPKLRTMTADEFRAIYKRLGFTQESAAEFVGMTGRQGQAWARHGVKSPAAAILFRLMLAYEIDALEVETVLRHA